MKKVAWVVHYRDESDVFDAINFKLKNNSFKRLFFKINSFFPPYVYSNFVSHEQNIDYYVILCPILGGTLAVLKKQKQLNILKKALTLANKLKIDQIGLAGVFSSIGENTKEFSNITKIPITASKNFIFSLVFEYIVQASEILAKDMKSCTLGIVGNNENISKVFLPYYKDKFCHILIDEENCESKKVNIVKKVSSETIFRNSDVFLINATGFGLGECINIIKPGSIVCDLMVPFYFTQEINLKRKDILAFEGVWVQYKEISNYKNKKGKFDILFPNQMLPACAAEPLILMLEDTPSYFSTADDINYNKTALISNMRKKYNFNVSGFKQGRFVYTNEKIERIKDAAKK